MRSGGWPPTSTTATRCGPSESRWRSWRPKRSTELVRGEVFRLPGRRYCVVVQAEEFQDLSTTLVAPTSSSARVRSFRPAITVAGTETRLVVEQTTVVDPQRLGASAGRLEVSELRAVDEALGL